MSNRNLKIIHILVLFVTSCVLYYLAPYSTFVKNVHSQYARIVLSLFTTGTLSTIISYCMLAGSKEVSNGAKQLLIVGTVLVAIIGFVVWIADPRLYLFLKESRIDWIASSLMMPLLIVIVARITEYINTKNQMALIHLYSVDIPLFCGAVILVLFRYIWYDLQSNEYFFEHIMSKFIFTVGDPQHLDVQASAMNLAKQNFWYGFSVGSLAIQLCVTQIASFFLTFIRLQDQKQGDK